MRFVRGLIAVSVLVGALWPELPRYRAERFLRGSQDALRYIVTRPSEVRDPQAALDRIALAGADVATALPGDPRPWIVAGAARLIRADPESAIRDYRLALACGERAESDLNLGRAYEAQGDFSRSRAAFLRAIWINPALLSALLPDVAAPLREELSRLEAELAAGRLASPPPPP